MPLAAVRADASLDKERPDLALSCLFGAAVAILLLFLFDNRALNSQPSQTPNERDDLLKSWVRFTPDAYCVKSASGRLLSGEKVRANEACNGGVKSAAT